MNELVGLARKVALQLAAVPGFQESWLVGSAARGDQAAQGIDLLVACQSRDFALNVAAARQALADFSEPGTWRVSDDSIIGSIGGVQTGIALHAKPVLWGRIDGYLRGEGLEGLHRSWATGYWLPETLCADLADAIPLNDKTGEATLLSSSLSPYPKALADGVQRLCREEATFKLVRVKRDLESGWTVESSLCCSDIAASAIRLAFARELVYLRGFHRIAGQRELLGEPGKALVDLAGEYICGYRPTAATLAATQEELRRETTYRGGSATDISGLLPPERSPTG